MSGLPKRLYGLVGHPVSHSLSPVLHNWGFSRLGLPGVYMAWDKHPLELPAFVEAVRALPISGVSITIPCKEAALPLVDKLTPSAQHIGAINTLYWEETALVGANTDMDGFLFPLEGKKPAAALVLGAGGAARAVLAGLAELGVKRVLVSARSPSKLARLQQDFNCVPVPWEERAAALRDLGPGLVVNVTPLGMDGEHCKESPIPEDAWPLATAGAEAGAAYSPFGGKAAHSRPGAEAENPFIAYDVVYNPRETVFLRQAKARGWKTLDGLSFFTAQGLSQFRLWTGQGLPFAEAMALIEATLKQRSQNKG